MKTYFTRRCRCRSARSPIDPASIAKDGDRRTFLRNRWDSIVDHPRWGQDAAGEREMVNYYYGFDFHGGLAYHGPGGGETFSVSLGDINFWGIHT